jgi:hypothetical protein
LVVTSLHPLSHIERATGERLDGVHLLSRMQNSRPKVLLEAISTAHR